MTADTADATPQNAIRALPMMRVFEHIGRQVQALGGPAADQFTVASALWSYILGVAGQSAANARSAPPDTDRAEFPGAVSAVWALRR
jgi:hypothetical protein